MIFPKPRCISEDSWADLSLDPSFTEFLHSGSAVIITKNDEAGVRQWSISPEDDPGDWIYSMSTLRDARMFCKSLGLPIAEIIKL